jgi:hypothetical protein
LKFHLWCQDQENFKLTSAECLALCFKQVLVGFKWPERVKTGHRFGGEAYRNGFAKVKACVFRQLGLLSTKVSLALGLPTRSCLYLLCVRVDVGDAQAIDL